jgi:hypothetical protein
MPYLPVTVTPGNYTPGAQTTLDFAASVINATWEQANLKYTDFEVKIANLGSWLDPASPPTMSASSTAPATVAEPVVSIPENIDTANILNVFDTQYQALVAMLVSKFTTFQADYFPNDATTYAVAESWIGEALANPAVGLPDAVAGQIWGDDQARILGDKGRATDALLQQFAARRYPLPPGAVAAATLQLERKAQDEIAESSRKVAILSVEQMRFVIEKALSMRGAAMSSALEYIKALVSAPDISSRMTGVGYDAQAKLISAASQFYNARTEARKLTAMMEQHNTDLAQEAVKANLQAELTIIEDKLKALLAEAQATAQMATSMFNNLHADAGTKYAVTV